jgi:hypothetical protein
LALFLAAPTALLFCVLTPFGFLSIFWMAAVSALAVTLYSRRQRPAWITTGAGARIGLVTGLITGWLVLALVAAALFVARYFFHMGGSVDDLWRNFVNLRMDPQWQSSGVDAQTIAKANSILLSPEGGAGFALACIGTLESMLLVASAAGGALGARMMARTRRPQQ